MHTTHTPHTGNKATATPALPTLPTSDAATELTLVRAKAVSALIVTLAQLRSPSPDWDKAFDFADRAKDAIGLLRIQANFPHLERPCNSTCNSTCNTAATHPQRTCNAPATVLQRPLNVR